MYVYIYIYIYVYIHIIYIYIYTHTHVYPRASADPRGGAHRVRYPTWHLSDVAKQ